MQRSRPKLVLGPDGSPLTMADLPSPDTKRWVIRRKAMVVAAVEGGLLSLDDVCKMYSLTVEEFLRWEMLMRQHGFYGLRSTRLQHYRHREQMSELPQRRAASQTSPRI